MDIREDQLKKWMIAAQKGDEVAYRRLLETITPMIRSYLSQKIEREQDVEDITQTILLALHQNRHTYKEELPFKNWLYGIARFKMMDFFRKHYRDKDYLSFNTDQLETFFGESPNNRQETQKDLVDLLDVLPEKQRTILYNTKIKGESIAEVALKMKMSVSNVKVTIHRAMEKLKDHVKMDKVV